jgi:hypothetical protein
VRVIDHALRVVLLLQLHIGSNVKRVATLFPYLVLEVAELLLQNCGREVQLPLVVMRPEYAFRELLVRQH